MKAVSVLFCIFMLCICMVANVSADQGYLIGDEDVLQLSVWGNPELNIQVPVRPDGMISFPLVGDVKATGVSPQDLKTILERDISKFVKDPTVSVIVTSINSFKVYVLGEGITTTSGVVTLKRNTSLLQLIAQLGSLKNADLENSFILRNDKKLTNDFSRLVRKGDISQDIQLATNDVVFMPDNFEKRITVVGAVRNPGTIPYKEGLTAVDAILNSGGFTEFAKQNDIVIVRKEGDSVKNIEARLKEVLKNGDISKDVLLRPGDLIIVKTGILRESLFDNAKHNMHVQVNYSYRASVEDAPRKASVMSTILCHFEGVFTTEKS